MKNRTYEAMDELREYSELAGKIEGIVFQNEENGYTVLRLLDETDATITVVGYIPCAAPGEHLLLQGIWGRHPVYGQQFTAQIVERFMPVSKEDMLEYLASGVIRGVGEATARKMVDLFGTETFTVLEQAPGQLTRIKGITKRRAEEIGGSFQSQVGMRRLLEFSAYHGLPLTLAVRLYRRYGTAAMEQVGHNPYLLLEEPFDVYFSAVDGLALSLGIEADDLRRVEAGVLFEINHNLNNGHSFLPRRKLVAATAQLLDVEIARAGEGLEGLLKRGEVIAETVAGEDGIYLARVYQAERAVTRRILEMCTYDFVPNIDLDQWIDQIEREQAIVYAPLQREAMRLATCRKIMLLTGGPGTGKTTSMRGVLHLLEALGLKTMLAAPTGRAAKRLGGLCGVEAVTIHRLLEAGYDHEADRSVFGRNREEPLDIHALLVDEASMVDILLMEALLDALPPACRLILVGDADQLPAIGPGNVFSDLIRSERIGVVKLTEIFRQAEESGIVRSAHAVNRGAPPLLGNRKKDFFFLRRAGQQAAVDTIVELCKTRLPQSLQMDPGHIQVLSPTRKHLCGTENLNRLLQQALNPPRNGCAERRFGDFIFREGDRVMQIKNNYDIIWKQGDGPLGGVGVFNGDIGHIERVDLRQDVVTVNYDGRFVHYSPDMLGELELAYAITVHKAQGSEYDAVVFAAIDCAPALLTRSVLYTGITRARKLFVGVGDENILLHMIANNRQRKRYSGLRFRLVHGE